MRRFPTLKWRAAFLLISFFGLSSVFAQYNCPAQGDCVIGPNPLRKYLNTLDGQKGVQVQTLDFRTGREVASASDCGCNGTACIVKVKVYGVNNITPVTPVEYPEYSGVNGIGCNGKITTSGSAFHVQRGDIIVTNSHVFQNLKTGEAANIKDCLYYVLDENNEIIETIPLKAARRAAIDVKEWQNDPEHDYAVVQLAYAPTKAKIKILPLEAHDGKETKVRIIGFDYYPALQKPMRLKTDGTVYAKQDGDLHATFPTLYAHDADTTTGFSGGAVINLATGKAIGIHSGWLKAPEEPKTSTNFSVKRNSNEFVIFDKWVLERVNEFMTR